MNPDLLAAACTAVSLCGLLVWAASANPVCPDTPLGELAQLDDQSIACTHAAIQDLRYTTDGMRLTLSDANHTLAAQSDRYSIGSSTYSINYWRKSERFDSFWGYTCSC
jgi:hypothetical protein